MLAQAINSEVNNKITRSAKNDDQDSKSLIHIALRPLRALEVAYLVSGTSLHHWLELRSRL